jgi:hypothetical protein
MGGRSATLMSSDLVNWLRGSQTRRMFARALGGGEHPNDTYLSMVTKTLDAVATEVADKPWADLPSAGLLRSAQEDALRKALKEIRDFASYGSSTLAFQVVEMADKALAATASPEQAADD